MDFTTTSLMWLIMGVMCFLLEMVLPGFIIFFFGVGAWTVAVASWLLPISLNYQLLIFLVSSLLSLFLLRGFIRKTFLGDEVSEDDNVSVSVGDTAEVTESITPPGEGKISYSGSSWKARSSDPIEKGETVTIISQDGLYMWVRKEVD